MSQSTTTAVTSLLLRTSRDEGPSFHEAPGGVAVQLTRRARLQAWLATKRGSLPWLLPLTIISGLVQAINMAGSPQRIDDEGTYVAQAYAIEKFGELTHYTYWYDHPPLGWLQIAGWTSLTNGFERYGSAVLAGREFMLVCSLAATVLLWMLARRLDFSRPAATATVAIYALSPLAVQFHRTVFLDNVATPWLLAAFVLVLAPRKQLVAFAAAAACFAVAVLSKETTLLFLPFLAWAMWRNAHRDIRRYTVSVATAVMVLLGLGYVVLALIKGELLPGADRVSLFSGLQFQLSGRAASGSLFDAGSQARVTTAQWLQLDPVIAVAAPIAALVALANRRVRPLAAALVFLLAFMLRPGYLPVPYVIAMIPLAALVIPAAVLTVVGRARRSPSAARRRTGIAVVSTVVVAALAFAVPMWGVQLRGLLRADLDQPMVQAEAWVAANVDRDYRVVVDDAMWVDLVEDGFDRDDVVWYYKVDTDPAVQKLAPNGWRDYDYIVTTNSMRTFPDGSPTVAEALKNSVEVATFGTGTTAVDVWRVQKQGADPAAQQAGKDERGRAYGGTELAANDNLALGPGVKDLLTGGRADARVIIGLGQLVDLATVTVADIPPLDGEDTLQRPRRSMIISELGGRRIDDASAAEITARLAAQPSPYAPRTVERTDQGLVVTYDADAPTGLLSAPQDL